MVNASLNFIQAESKSPADSNTSKPITINLSDNFSDVRGFGQPIPISLGKRMAKRYCDTYESIHKLINAIELNEDNEYTVFKSNPAISAQFELLKNFLHPDNHIVSGVFGKEIILQTIAQKQCEGIRYIFGIDDSNRITIVLAGVKETNYPKWDDNLRHVQTANGEVAMRRSETLPSAQYFKDVKAGKESRAEDPSVPEVHTASLTVQGLRDELNLKLKLEGDTELDDILFGEF